MYNSARQRLVNALVANAGSLVVLVDASERDLFILLNSLQHELNVFRSELTTRTIVDHEGVEDDEL